ncbi:hypothetical protein HPB51_010407 [Rhipicephalus microplus]|uniref:Uncharacterized protein n=1 Tax=Rhipicephalus microplus TaxID=6941 RepID=A0A9J6E8E2_RHIMP|nr:hypothetical protein HPB51_010407 [Rhipicephalus microplus]
MFSKIVTAAVGRLLTLGAEAGELSRFFGTWKIGIRTIEFHVYAQPPEDAFCGIMFNAHDSFTDAEISKDMPQSYPAMPVVGGRRMGRTNYVLVTTLGDCVPRWVFYHGVYICFYPFYPRVEACFTCGKNPQVRELVREKSSLKAQHSLQQSQLSKLMFPKGNFTQYIQSVEAKLDETLEQPATTSAFKSSAQKQLHWLLHRYPGTDAELLEELARRYVNLAQPNAPPERFSPYSCKPKPQMDEDITEAEIYAAMLKLRKTSPPDLDGVGNESLRNLDVKSVAALSW